ncbi:MAG: hypothetical protein PHH12_03030, partial [Candidatus Shapirobacteria bacterium]|nr:hypothetical protein [Candidatus Shapirobacteria bacterium]
MYLKIRKISIIILILLSAFFIVKPIFADVVDDCIKDNRNDPSACIDLVKKQINDLENAINPLKKESTGLQSKITSAKSQIFQIEKQVVSLGQQLIEKESDLEVQRLLLSERVKRYYKNSKKFNSFLIFFANKENSSLFQQYTWYQSIISQDKNTITQYSSEIKTLNDNKNKIEAEKVKLDKIKKDLENRFGFLSTEIKKAENYKGQLNSKLKDLEAQRIAKLNLPTSAGSGGISCVDDRKVDPGFGTGFAFFTFGIPHHVGLNQYGALGRAKAGQSAEDIIRAYYQNIEISGGKEGENVKVNGTNEFGQTFNNEVMNIEEYLKHIYEMPTSWPESA